MIRPQKVAGFAAFAVFLALCLGACTSGSGDAARAGNTPRQQAPSTPSMSISQYGTTLEGVVRQLDTALKDLEKAKGYKGLNGRLTKVQDATQQASTALGELKAPVEIAAEHQRLVGALRQAYSTVGTTSDQVGQRVVCTGPAARAKVGDDPGTAELRAAVDAIKPRLPGTNLTLTLPRAGQKVGSRPSNGNFIRAGSRNGNGRLTVDNGGGDDAVVTLRKGSKTAFSVYVRKGKKAVVNGVPDGKYTVYFTGGSDWDKKTRAFSRDCAFQRFEETLSYSTRYSATQISYQTWTITLHTVTGGNAKTSDVNPEEFPES